MTYPVRQRAASALAHIWTALRDGLAAQITAINDDLLAASAAYRLPPVPSASIVLRVQEPDLPQGITYPEVRLVAGGQAIAQDASGRSGLTQLGVSVACYLDAAALSSAQTDAGLTVDTSESILALAVLDLAAAVARLLRDPVAGVYDPTSGVVQIVYDGTRAPQIHQVPAPGYRTSALWCAVEIRIVLEETY